MATKTTPKKPTKSTKSKKPGPALVLTQLYEIDDCVGFFISAQARRGTAFNPSLAVSGPQCFAAADGFVLRSSNEPQIGSERLYVRGDLKDSDRRRLECPIETYKRIVQAVREYNQMIVKLPPTPKPRLRPEWVKAAMREVNICKEMLPWVEQFDSPKALLCALVKLTDANEEIVSGYSPNDIWVSITEMMQDLGVRTVCRMLGLLPKTSKTKTPTKKSRRKRVLRVPY